MRGQLPRCTRTNVCLRVYGDVVLHKAVPWHACDHYIMASPWLVCTTHNHVTSCRHLRSTRRADLMMTFAMRLFPAGIPLCVCLNPSVQSIVQWRKWLQGVMDMSKCAHACLPFNSSVNACLWIWMYVLDINECVFLPSYCGLFSMSPL